MLKIVCFGDSITARKEGFPTPMLTAKLEVVLENVEVINAGVSGNNTVQALDRIEKDVVRHKPDLVTVLFGANDAALHKMIDLETFKMNLYEMTHVLSPQKTILISPAPVDESLQSNRTNAILRNYARAVEQVAEDTGSHFIDLFSHIINLENYPAILIGEKNDGLHFGEPAYNLLVQLIVDKIKWIVSTQKDSESL